MMIWTLEAAPPWRVTAIDHAQAPSEVDDTHAPPFLDLVAIDDRGIVASALAAATTQGAGACDCRITRSAGSGGASTSATGHLDLVRVSAHAAAVNRGERQIIAIWKTGPAPVVENAPRVIDDQTMRQFLGQVSHELRTPLNGVLGMTRLLLDSGLRADQVDYARAIDTSGEHLLSVIEDLLEFATLDVKTALHPVEFSPRALIEDVVDGMTRRAAEKDIEICAIVSAPVPELVLADAARVRQVLSYLVSDAIASTEMGDVVVRVSLESAAAASGEATLKFEIAGNTGIPDDDDPVAVRDKTTDPGPRATVCRHLVALMGGALGPSWFTARVAPKALPPATIPEQVSLAGRRVLCVDDHPLSQRVLLERLRGWNLQAEATDDPHSALTLMKVASSASTPFDLVILDLRLPGMDGLALARLIKADPALASTRLVMLTGYPARGQATLAHEAGIDVYLQKPIREAPLRASLDRLLGGASQPSTLPTLGERRITDGRSVLRPRVLIAEDNPLSQKVAVQMLEKLGCRVDVVSDGEGAIDAVTRTAYHLVLMDCHMPGVDGVEAARRIRALPDHASSPPIVALTGEAREYERTQCLDAGMNDFLTKPLRLGTLREKLAQWIESAPHAKV
jgi:two-component system, sensor histidine kinase and response regulator